MDIITRSLFKIKGYIWSNLEEVGVSLIIIFVAISSYFLGRSAEVFDSVHEPVTVEYIDDNSLAKSTSTGLTTGSNTEVVATLHGKKYYLPWCSVVAKLAPEAKRHFASVAEAESFGLTPAKNCAGMNSN